MTATKRRKSATQRLIEERLGRSLRPWVMRRRRDQLSWRRITDEIREKTGVTITPVAVRGWFPDL